MSGEGDAGTGIVPETPAGGAEGAAGGGGQVQGGAGGGDGGSDPIAKLVASMDAFQGTIGQRLESFEQRLPAAASAVAEEDDTFDLAALLEGLPDEAFQDGQITPEGNMELMRQVARAEADAVRTEQQLAAQQQEHDAYADHLEETYPDLAVKKTQEQVIAEAKGLAARMGQPSLATNPYFIEQVFLSMAARARMASETPAQHADRGVQLEQPGGGGGPVDSGNGQTTQQRIVDAATGSRFRLGT